MNEGIADALFLLLRLLVAYLVFAVARHSAVDSKCPKYKAYLYALGASAFFAWMSWKHYGTHVEDADPVWGGGTEVIDFEPSDAERNRQGLFMFTVLSALSVTGVFLGLKARDEKDRQRRAPIGIL